jgi:hypothetical protein
VLRHESLAAAGDVGDADLLSNAVLLSLPNSFSAVTAACAAYLAAAGDVGSADLLSNAVLLSLPKSFSAVTAACAGFHFCSW